MKHSDVSGFALGGAKGGGIPLEPVRIAVFCMLATVILFVPDLAHAQLFDGIVDVLDEATLTFTEAVAGFFLMCGMVVGWMVGTKNFPLGVTIVVATISFATMVANNEEIASAIGFGG